MRAVTASTPQRNQKITTTSYHESGRRAFRPRRVSASTVSGSPVCREWDRSRHGRALTGTASLRDVAGRKWGRDTPPQALLPSGGGESIATLDTSMALLGSLSPSVSHGSSGRGTHP